MSTTPITANVILARLDRIPFWPYARIVLLAIGAGFFFAFFDVVIIGLVLPDIEQQFQVTADTAAWTITTSLIGYILGAFVVGRISDRYGRRKAIFVSISLFTVGSFFCALSSNIDMLIFWRFISGMGIGSEIAVATTLMGELTPAPCRGKYTSWAVGCGMLGFAVVPFVGMALLPEHTWGWRALFLIASASGIIIALSRFFVPESPRWLISQNRVKEAEAMVQQAEIHMKNKGIILPEIKMDVENNQPPHHLSFMELLKSAYFPYLLLFVVIWFVYYLGNYAWLTLGTSLFIDKGFTLVQSLGFVSLSSLGFILGTGISIWIADKFERKHIAFIILLIWSAALLLIGWFPSVLMIIISGFIAAASIAALIPILYIYTAEHFPTSIRTTCIAITDGLGHLGGAICGQVTLGVYAWFKLSGFGFAASFSCMALTGLITAACVLLGKKVTGRSLS